MAEDTTSELPVDVDHPSLFKITAAQNDRMEKNKLKAKALRQGRMTTHHPYSANAKGPNKTNTSSNVVPRSSGPSAGGYMIDESDLDKPAPNYRLVEDEAPPLPGEEFVCTDCGKLFSMSFLKTNFDMFICDVCRRENEKYNLISKTEAKQTFILKDFHFEECDGPPLQFINRRNPHNPLGGSMKLYLKSQVESRAHSVWGGEEGLLAEKSRKLKNKERLKEIAYEKKIKELRRAVSARRSVATADQPHQHVYPTSSEVYNNDEDTWTKTCSECGFQVTFEKM